MDTAVEAEIAHDAATRQVTTPTTLERPSAGDYTTSNTSNHRYDHIGTKSTA